MAKYSLGKLVIGSQWLEDGAIANSDGSISKAFEMEPLSSGGLERIGSLKGLLGLKLPEFGRISVSAAPLN